MRRNAREQLERGSGPYFYLPEARVAPRGAAVGRRLRARRGGARPAAGSIRCTVLIETILAAFEMEEILYELRDWGCALNAGRWDYIFSAIKKFRARDWVLPDRVQVTMTVPFMRAYTELLVRSCHRRGAHAIGGMAAFIPSRKDAGGERDRAREGARGQGARVARRLRRHPGSRIPISCPVCTEVFDAVLGERPNQLERLREDVVPDAAALLSIPGHARRDHRRRACARTSRSASATSTPGCTASARRRSTT